ncbi:Phenylpyruvate tautomerase PptA, 4-oxalocrotonate tautomerase family [Streptomyces qinglanensis]|uniref:Phenylpyruvate tautomerase PptA, 4-oxalocrotonate tautomerase family n=1 Tax=Streptomyces qinglanensis TaxID=943816 RepID=A0A1H9VB58_9ACTN|nr:Phenylpyruvate tautomerase PptA, 4-oxalocrotonate tautomerase family [Streptomyces qinglanensis]
MPHFEVQVHEEVLGGEDAPVSGQLIKELTEAALTVYPEPFREMVGVEIFGIPRGRWGVGGKVTDEPSPVVTLRSREGFFHHPDFAEAPAGLISAITDAVANVLGERVRGRVTVLLVGVPAGRSGVGGEPV